MKSVINEIRGMTGIDVTAELETVLVKRLAAAINKELCKRILASEIQKWWYEWQEK
jgi:hypothetical protein